MKDWLKSRHTPPLIRFIAENFRTWRDWQQFERGKRNTEASVGSQASWQHVAALIPDALPADPVETEPIPRAGAYGQALEILAESLPENVIASWFAPLADSVDEQNRLHLAAGLATEAIRIFIENNHADEFYSAIERAGLAGVVFEDLPDDQPQRTAARVSGRVMATAPA